MIILDVLKKYCWRFKITARTAETPAQGRPRVQSENSRNAGLMQVFLLNLRPVSTEPKPPHSEDNRNTYRLAVGLGFRVEG